MAPNKSLGALTPTISACSGHLGYPFQNKEADSYVGNFLANSNSCARGAPVTMKMDYHAPFFWRV